MRKPTIWVSDQVQHKPACTGTEDSYKHEISDEERRRIVLSMFHVAKTKALISFVVTVKLSFGVTTKLLCAFISHSQIFGFLMLWLNCIVKL